MSTTGNPFTLAVLKDAFLFSEDDESLSELLKEYESEDSIGDELQNTQLA